MGKIHQAHTSLTCGLGNMLTGLLYVWPSYTIVHFTKTDTEYLNAPMTEIESSLVGSLPSLGAMAGTVLVGWLMSIFGRQKTGLILAFPMLASWLMIDLTRSSMVILIARFLSGVSGGGFLVHSPIFISEVAEPSIRGTLASAPMTFYCIGILVSYLMGWFLTYRYIIWGNLVCCIVYAALMITVTESPVYLLRQNREEEARLAISHYLGGSVNSKAVLEEFSRLKEQVVPAVELVAKDPDQSEKQKLNSEINDVEQQTKDKMSPMKMLFVSPASRRAFTTVFLILSLQVMMGMIAVQVYAKDIFTHAAPNLSSHFCSVMFASTLLLGSLINGLLLDKFGRKIPLISSSIATGVCLVGLGFFIQTSIAPAWVTALMILFFCFSFMSGAGSVPYVMLAEMFTSEVQSVASMILMEWVWLLNFLLVGVFPFMIKFLGVHGAFYSFALFALFDCLVAIFVVPETKGLTIDQIQKVLLYRPLK
ncbi:unnamed protein product [Danaus chrysippus]|uniref:(African queen) hypothetical protein n=1 Tax=Danaus chrysippus TaxID=151541 RepID=A0A8J2QSR4_9NEOP|nr:unnamed protein product [Danaus chrysippus]